MEEPQSWRGMDIGMLELKACRAGVPKKICLKGVNSQKKINFLLKM